jgi:hypothetical protein
MLGLIDEGLEAFFRASVPLGAAEVDVSFEPPEREWSSKLTRPTVNLFLWDIRRSAARSRAGVEEIQRDGKTVRRMALPIIELRYLVTAWTSDHGDERALLGGLMRAILANSLLPVDYLPGGFADLKPPTMMMAMAGEEHVDVFKTLEGQLKPGLNIVVTTEVDTGLEDPVGPDVVSIGTALSDFNSGATSSSRRVAGDVLIDHEPGTVVSSPTDATEVNAVGRFLIRAAEGDELTLHVDPPRTVLVPEAGGIRFE